MREDKVGSPAVEKQDLHMGEDARSQRTETDVAVWYEERGVVLGKILLGRMFLLERGPGIRSLVNQD